MRTTWGLSLLLLGVWVVMRPAMANACSCGQGPTDLGEALTQARDLSATIYLAQVLSIEPGLESQLARVKVLETFKGEVPVGLTPMVPTGGLCMIPLKVGNTYVIYGWASWCSRTREIRSVENDLELTWLRTGVLPPKPRALLRETVRCEPCSLETVTAGHIGSGQPRPFRKEEVLPAFDAGAPFWAAGFYDLENDRRQVAVGRASDGGTFELVQTPFFGTRELCRQRVVKRSCERLEPRSDNSLGEPPLRCVHPGPEVEVCNEELSRVATWGRLEELSGALCDWRDPAVGRCTLTEKPSALRGRGAAPRAVLRCSPEFDTPRFNACVVVVEGADGGR
jgi:hypothetical protein